MNPGNWPPLAVNASGKDCWLSPKKYRPVRMFEALKLWSIFAIKLVRRLNDGETTELFGPLGQPSFSEPTSEPPKVPGIFGRGPGIRRQQSCDHRIACAAVCRDLSRIRNAGQCHDADRLLLPFVVEIEECLVFHDRAANRAAVLVVVERRLRLVRSD